VGEGSVTPLGLDLLPVDLLDARGHSRRVVVRPREAGETINEDERADALRMRRRGHHRHLDGVALGDNGRLLGLDGIHDRDEVVHPRLDRDVSHDRG